MSLSAASLSAPTPTDELARLAGRLQAVVAEVEMRLLHRRAAALDEVSRAAAELAGRFRSVAPQVQADLALTSREAAEALEGLAAELDRPRPRWPSLRRQWEVLVRAYEALRVRVRRLAPSARAVLETVKPFNLRRNLFHVMMGLTGVALYELVLSRTMVLVVGGAALAGFLGLEAARRLSPSLNERMVHGALRWISRPGEVHRVPGATWYLMALLIGVLAFPQHAVELGTLVLAFGDPAASIAGKRWGRRKLLGQKSLAGTLAFVAVATGVGLAFLAWVQPELGLAAAAGVAGGAAVVGALAELFSGRLDDNFTVPLLATAAAALLGLGA